MIEVREKELVKLVDGIKHILKREDMEELEKDYKKNMDQAVKDGYSKVFIKKYFEEFVFRKITKDNK